jgi:hypothetical protein
MTIVYQTVTAGNSYSRTITASNTIYFAAENLPQGLSINQEGVISGVLQQAGRFAITILARGVGGTSAAILDLTVNTPPVPFITSVDEVTHEMATAFSYQITASSPTAILSYGATNLPTGLSVNTGTGLITGTPTSGSDAAAVFSTAYLSATNAVGTGYQDLLFTLPQRPVITSSLTPLAFIAGDAITPYTITASKSPTLFGASSLPSGLSVNTATGVISGTSNSLGAYTIGLSANNTFFTATANLPISVNSIPTITSGNASGRQLLAFSYQITVTAFPNPTSYGASGLPSGLTINTSTGLISGTPSVTGSFSVTLSATNSVGTGTVPVIFSLAEAYGLFGAQVKQIAPSATYNILFADYDNNAVRTLSGNTLGTLSGAVPNPWGLVETPNGTIYVSSSDGYVKKRVGSSWVNVAGPYGSIFGMCADQNNSVYACTNTSNFLPLGQGSIIKITSAGAVSTFVSQSTFLSARNFWVAPGAGNLTVAQQGYTVVEIMDITPMLSGGNVVYFSAVGLAQYSVFPHAAHFIIKPDGSDIVESDLYLSYVGADKRVWGAMPFSGSFPVWSPSSGSINYAFIKEGSLTATDSTGSSKHYDVQNYGPGLTWNSSFGSSEYAYRVPVSQPITSSVPHSYYVSMGYTGTVGPGYRNKSTIGQATWQLFENPAFPYYIRETVTPIATTNSHGFRDGPIT